MLKKKEKRERHRGVLYSTVQYPGTGYEMRARGGWESSKNYDEANLELEAECIEPAQTAAMRVAHQHT